MRPSGYYQPRATGNSRLVVSLGSYGRDTWRHKATLVKLASDNSSSNGLFVNHARMLGASRATRTW